VMPMVLMKAFAMKRRKFIFLNSQRGFMVSGRTIRDCPQG
jgi:hypothetical protein